MSESIHRVVVWQDSKGLDFAQCGDVEVSSRKSVTADLARKLVAAGEPDGPMHVYGQDGRLRYTIESLHYWATRTLSEPDKGGIKFTDWAPNPMAEARKTSDTKKDPQASVPWGSSFMMKVVRRGSVATR